MEFLSPGISQSVLGTGLVALACRPILKTNIRQPSKVCTHARIFIAFVYSEKINTFLSSPLAGK